VSVLFLHYNMEDSITGQEYMLDHMARMEEETKEKLQM
jgi:hypothetical protein